MSLQFGQSGLTSGAGLVPQAGLFPGAGLRGFGAGVLSPLTDGYYFFDAQTLSAGNVTPWDGSLPDSPNDLGLIATQTTSGNQPTADGTVVIFDSNSEHYDIPSTSQAGWQIVGTSLGTFAYKVDADAITELNLLGNLGSTTFRQTGDLYGIILLPDTATAAQVEAARQLLISRGAADGVTGASLRNFWRERADIVEFKSVDTSSVTDFYAAWFKCYSLTSFDFIETSNGDNFNATWADCSSLTSFDFIDVLKGRRFYATWLNCNSLTLFPAGMFDSWNPTSIDNEVFNNTWDGCSSLTPQSVENILVSIATSGKYATTSGASGGTALTDPEIDIDYDGTVLTAATNTAIETLNGRGWAVKINGEIIVPNILQLQPAAAYSLRSFDSAADPNVVNVRRSSDGATSDFTASEVSDGTLRDWTLGDTLALDGQRMHFDGIDDKVDVSSLDIGNLSEITIKTRILWQNGIDTNEGIFTNGSTVSNRFGLFISNQLLFYIGDGVQTFYPSVVNLNTNQYYDVIATAKVENGQMTARMFVDGVDYNEASISTSATDFSVVAQNWVIGYLNVNRYFKGIIDYVEVYEGYSTDGSVTGMTALHKWTNTDITNASWVDQVGSIDGTVSGSPALFSGQGFDSYVTTWYDQSGSGNHSTQSTASSQPLIVDNGVLVTENGEAALDINKTPLVLASTISFNDLTWFAVTKKADDGGIDSVIFDGSNGATYGGDDIDNGGNPVLRNDVIYATLGNTSASGGEISQHLSYYNRNGSKASGGLNGEVNTEATASIITFVLSKFFNYSSASGSDTFDYVGKAQEIVVFNTDQTSNRTGIENNINNHFNIY